MSNKLLLLVAMSLLVAMGVFVGVVSVIGIDNTIQPAFAATSKGNCGDKTAGTAVILPTQSAFA
jgi:hypothetical protein